MGVCLVLVFDKKFPEAHAFSDFTDGKILAHAVGALDEVCDAKGLTAFSTFVAAEVDADELSEGEVIEDSFFDCSDGLRIIPELVVTLQSEKKWLKGWNKTWVAGLIESLQELERCLKMGKKNKARFHLFYC